jgi:hypothetical protein
MPLFEVDAERPVLVQPPQPAGAFGTDAQRVVDGNLDSLLGEQIFPVAHGTSEGEPHLLALDAAGLPVVIEVTAELTEEALTTALNHAGRAGRLTRAELAARYSGGASRFQQDVAAFYDNVPLTRSQATARTTGARLIVICSSAAEGIQDALDFLRQPGSPVAVLRLGVVNGADGRRFVDVSPLAVSRDNPAPPAAPEPARGRAVAPGSDFADGVAVGRALTGKFPVVTRQAALSRAERRRAAELEPRTTYGITPTSAQETGQLAPVPADEPARPEPPVLDFVPPADPLVARTATEPVSTGWADRRPVEAPEEPLVPRTAILTRESVRTRESIRTRESYLTHEYGEQRTPAAERAYDPLSYHPPVTSDPDPVPVGRDVVPVPAPPAVDAPLGPDDDPDLVALARAFGAPRQLVWSRPRRGQRFEAVLQPDGFIELSDGARFRHPDLAAVAASGTSTADGWSVWRLGADDGPTLTDAFRDQHA